MVYKLVYLDNIPRIKLSEEVEKTTIPGAKSILRVYTDTDSHPSLDVICLSDE